jgi:hypothetical protein
MPVIRTFNIPPNCSDTITTHHCAKLYDATIELTGFTTEPHVEWPGDPSVQGKYTGTPAIRIYADKYSKEIPMELLLNVSSETDDVKETGATANTAKNKIIGLQLGRRQKLDTRTSSLKWNSTTTDVVLHVQFRVRSIRQSVDHWEFRDDAGSGTRGRARDFSKFRFSAQLKEGKMTNTNAVGRTSCAQTCARVWSKGNCPARTRRGYVYV